jgi:hypothetical protein
VGTPISLEAYIATPGDLNVSADDLDLDSFEWEDVFMDKGRVTFQVPLPRPDSLVTEAVVVLVLNGDVKPQQVAIIDTYDEITDCEPEDQCVKVSAYLTAHALSRGRIQPSRGYGAVPFEDVRVFNVFSPDFNISGWGTASAIVAHQGWVSTFYTGRPSGWSYPDSVLIGPQNGNDHAGELGQWWTQAEFTIATDTNIVFDCAADNWAEFWLDGQMIGTINGWGSTTSFTAFCKAGTHRIGAKVYNSGDYTSAKPPLNSGGVVTEGNPTFFLMAAFAVNYKGERGALIIQTDTSWKIRAFLATAPGWTFGAVALHVLQEIQAQGQLTGWTPGWTAIIDSNGAAWPIYETISVDVARDYLETLQEWSTSYCDWWAFARFSANDYLLNLYKWSTSPTGSTPDGVPTYAHDEDPEVSNLDRLTTTTAAIVADNVQVRWAGGWLRVPDSGGFKQGFLKMGACHSEAEAGVVATRWLEVFGVERVKYRGEIAPRTLESLTDSPGDMPYRYYQCGNEVTIAGHQERVVRIKLTKTDGDVDVEVDTKDWISYVEDRLEWALQRLSDGT